jgi:peptidoglycan/LPS O-acetylase OafA/YrhL
MLALSRGRWKVLASMISVLGLALLAFDLWSTAPARGKDMYSYQTLLPTRAWELLAGCLLAVILSSGALTHLRERRWWSFVGGLGLALILGEVCRHRAAGPLADEFFRSIMRSGTIIAAVGSVLLVLSLAMSSRGPLARMLSLAPMVWIGRISYGLYVFHYPVFHIVAAHTTSARVDGYSAWINVVQFAVTFAVATLSFYFWEKPFLRLKGSVKPAAPATPAVATSAVPAARRPEAAQVRVHARAEATVEMPRVVMVSAQGR